MDVCEFRFSDRFSFWHIKEWKGVGRLRMAFGNIWAFRERKKRSVWFMELVENCVVYGDRGYRVESPLESWLSYESVKRMEEWSGNSEKLYLFHLTWSSLR